MVSSAKKERGARASKGGKAIMEIIKNQEGQTSALFIFVGGMLLLGGFYIIFGVFMGSLVVSTNQLIANPALHWSQPHKTATDYIFRAWWLLPVLFILYYIYWTVKKALERKPEDIYI